MLVVFLATTLLIVLDSKLILFTVLDVKTNLSHTILMV